jgi:glutamyl-tRNA reductase
MKFQLIGCSHHTAPVEVRERLAFSGDQAQTALADLRQRFPAAESVLVSTCNRVEVYTAAEDAALCPTHHQLVEFLASFHQLDAVEIFDALFERTGEDAVRHLFLAQVKQAYDLARLTNSAGPLTNAAFQAALRVAKRVATETAINQRRISIPSVAVADFAKAIFERFEDKRVLVIGAGEMGEETVRYLIDEGVRKITVVNRHWERAQRLAAQITAIAQPWDDLPRLLAEADLVISTTGAAEPILTAEAFVPIHHARHQRSLFMLDLAVPRDIDPAVGDFLGVYLYSIDDLKAACDANRREREKEWPKAERIVDDETARFMAELAHRATGPTIQRLKAQADEVKTDELRRLLNKLGDLDERSRCEIGRSFDRLVNKLLHPPLESLRDEAESGPPDGLLEALKRLFQLRD